MTLFTIVLFHWTSTMETTTHPSPPTGDSGTPPPTQDEMETGGGGESSSDQEETTPSTGADANKPVAINSIIGTTWCVVWTGDSRSFFYNSLTKESHWVMPDELQNNLQVQKLLANPPKSAKKHG